jgi:hypothetical protein
MRDSQHKSHNETPPKHSHKNPPKWLRKSLKKKNEIHKKITRGHKDELQTFHSPRGKIIYKEASNLPLSYSLEDLREALALGRKKKGKSKEQMN